MHTLVKGWSISQSLLAYMGELICQFSLPASSNLKLAPHQVLELLQGLVMVPRSRNASGVTDSLCRTARA